MQNTRGEWRTLVKRFLSRRSFINDDVSAEIVKKLGYAEFYGPQPTTILDIHPGTASFSAALNQSIKPHRHILMEPFPVFKKFLQSIERRPEVFYGQEDPFRWSTFQNLVKNQIYEPETQSRSQIHNSLLLTSNLMHAQGEQLVTQYLNCIANQSWIQQYGRVRLLLWMRAATAKKLVAGPGESARHRIGCQRESCCDVRVVIHEDPPARKRNPLLDSKYPRALRKPLVSNVDLVRDFTKPVPDVSLIELTPHEHQVDHIDEFEFVIKNLCVLNNTPLSQSLNSLGPGAVDDLSPELADILHLKPSQLGITDFQRITKAFVNWPFKPEMLLDFYEQTGFSGIPGPEH